MSQPICRHQFSSLRAAALSSASVPVVTNLFPRSVFPCAELSRSGTARAARARGDPELSAPHRSSRLIFGHRSAVRAVSTGLAFPAAVFLFLPSVSFPALNWAAARVRRTRHISQRAGLCPAILVLRSMISSLAQDFVPGIRFQLRFFDLRSSWLL
jgi:hypothetical protein